MPVGSTHLGLGAGVCARVDEQLTGGGVAPLSRVVQRSEAVLRIGAGEAGGAVMRAPSKPQRRV